MRCLFLLPALLLGLLIATPSPTRASVENGYVNSDGYTWKDGFWWKSGCAYTRTKYTKASYYYCGTCYPATSYYKYAQVPIATKTVVTPADPDWRSKLLDLAGQRDKVEGKIRQNAFEQYYFLEAVNALGLTGNFRIDGYGQAMPAAAYQLSHAGVNASTVYGYTYNTIASVYGDANLGQLYQQAARLTENAQKLAGQANVDFSELIGKEGDNRAKVAAILAKGQAAGQALEALREQGSAKIETRSFSFKTGHGHRHGSAETTDDLAGQVAVATQRQALIQSRCMGCHNAQDAATNGNLDMESYENFTPEQKKAVWSRLFTADPAKLMPRGPDGRGQRLSPKELQLFLSN